MSVSTLMPAPTSLMTTGPFPQAAVEACLRKELIEVVTAEAGIKSIALPRASADISKVSFHIDSLVVVSILCAVEPIVGFELPDRVVRAGGYESVESALKHFCLASNRSGLDREEARHDPTPGQRV
jgi:hypothetical protein